MHFTQTTCSSYMTTFIIWCILVFTENDVPFRYLRSIIICYQLEFNCVFDSVLVVQYKYLCICSYLYHYFRIFQIDFASKLIFCGLFSFTLISFGSCYLLLLHTSLRLHTTSHLHTYIIKTNLKQYGGTLYNSRNVRLWVFYIKYILYTYYNI